MWFMDEWSARLDVLGVGSENGLREALDVECVALEESVGMRETRDGSESESRESRALGI